MCNFFSCNSDGQGNAQFFKIEDVARIMAEGNKENYDFNSHTSIARFHGIHGGEEDKWNKWEYNIETKTLKSDSIVTTDDGKIVKEKIEDYLKDKSIAYMQNLYGKNSGDRNSGNRNSGYRNSGDGNSGDGNSGNRNSGDRNSGNRNSGYRNSGYRNSGDGNSGDGNSGDGNSGNRNSGDGNSGCIIGHFSSIKQFFLFNKPCTEEEACKVYNIELWRYFNLTEWITENEMTEEEKRQHPSHKITDGYLKTRTYKEAWALVPKEIIGKIKQLANFDKDVFKEITGLDV